MNNHMPKRIFFIGKVLFLCHQWENCVFIYLYFEIKPGLFCFKILFPLMSHYVLGYKSGLTQCPINCSEASDCQDMRCKPIRLSSELQSRSHFTDNFILKKNNGKNQCNFI